MRISDWSSDVCSSDLTTHQTHVQGPNDHARAATSLDGHIPGLPLHGVSLTGPLPHRIKRLQPLRRPPFAGVRALLRRLRVQHAMHAPYVVGRGRHDRPPTVHTAEGVRADHLRMPRLDPDTPRG